MPRQSRRARWLSECMRSLRLRSWRAVAPRMVIPGCLSAAMLLAASGCGGNDEATAAGEPAAGELAIARDDAAARSDFDAVFGQTYADAFGDGLGQRHDDGRAQAWSPALHSTRFRRSDALAREISSSFLADYRPIETLTRPALATLVSSGDALAAMHVEMARSGLAKDDLADALAMHDLVHWSIANRERVSERRIAAVRNAVMPRARRLAADADDDRARQAIADRAAILAAIRSNEFARLMERGDPAATRRYSDRVAESFRARHGIDLRAGPAEATLAGDARATR